MTDHRQQLTALLEAVAAVPSRVEWTVAAIRSLDLILLCDDRDEATTMLMEAIAGRHGEVVAVASVSDTVSGRELAGCLIRPYGGGIDAKAAELRLAYTLATGSGSDRPPF